MKENRLLHTGSLRLHYVHLQAFEFFVSKMYDYVQIKKMTQTRGNYYKIDMLMPENINSNTILQHWERWRYKLLNEMYAAKN